jgi:hypothetical protein
MSSKWQHKMFNYEETPPKEVWEKLLNELDDAAMSYSYPSRLANLEKSPPENTWHNIEMMLDAGTEKPASIIRPLFPYFKYAAAAVIIAFIAWGGYSLFINKPVNNSISQQESANSTLKNIINPPEVSTGKEAETQNTTADNAEMVEEAKDKAALEKIKGTYAALDISTNKKLKNVSNFYFSVNTDAVNNNRNTDNNSIENPGEIDMADRYIMLMTPDGNIIRVSKKLGNLVCCVTGEEQDQNCVDQMKQWRDKMANSAVGHSPGNFMDIFNLVNTLQGNKE